MSAYGYWKLNFMKLCTSIMACDTVYVFYELWNVFKHLKQRKTFKQMLLNLKEISSFIRKNIKLVQEEDSMIHSKETVLQLRYKFLLFI